MVVTVEEVVYTVVVRALHGKWVRCRDLRLSIIKFKQEMKDQDLYDPTLFYHK